MLCFSQSWAMINLQLVSHPVYMPASLLYLLLTLNISLRNHQQLLNRQLPISDWQHIEWRDIPNEHRSSRTAQQQINHVTKTPTPRTALRQIYHMTKTPTPRLFYQILLQKRGQGGPTHWSVPTIWCQILILLIRCKISVFLIPHHYCTQCCGWMGLWSNCPFLVVTLYRAAVLGRSCW